MLKFSRLSLGKRAGVLLSQAGPAGEAGALGGPDAGHWRSGVDLG